MARLRLERRALLVVFAAALLLAGPAWAKVLYSLDADSPRAVGDSNSHLLLVPSASAPASTSPTVDTAASALGLSGGSLDEVDALSLGGAGSGVFHFSVDRFSLEQEAAKPGRPASSSDDLDALALDGRGPLYFSLAAGNLSALGGADVLAPGPSVVIPASALGLTFLDDIDALHVDDVNGDVYFSLTPASPSLASLGAGPADVLVVRGGSGRPEIYAAAAGLGLGPGDNVDALAFADGERAGVELAGPCVAPTEADDGSDRAAPRAAVADLVFAGRSGQAPQRIDPACGRDLALRPPAVVACVGPRVAGRAAPPGACP